MLPTAGVGELRLLAPALSQLSQQPRWQVWLNPPFVPYAPALQTMRIASERVLLIRTQNHTDALWALERCLRSGACSMALAWLDESQLRFKDTQRLQVAAIQGHTLTCLLRPVAACKQASQAVLRLAIRPTGITANLSANQLSANPKDAMPAGLNAGLTNGIDAPQDAFGTSSVLVDVLKRRGGWPVYEVPLELVSITPRAPHSVSDVRALLAAWRNALPDSQTRPNNPSTPTRPHAPTTDVVTVGIQPQPNPPHVPAALH